MKKELLFPLTFAAATLVASVSYAAEWQDASNLPPEPPPEELRAAAAAAAAPGAIPAAQAATPAPSAVAPTPAAPAQPAPAPARVDVQPAPVSAPPDEIKTVTPVVSTWHTSKATSIVLHNATLRTRPTGNGKGDPIAAETRVRMESSVINAEGTWWFVTATGIGGGWMLEKELGDPQQ